MANDPAPDVIERIEAVEHASWTGLYAAARALGAGWHHLDGATAFWLPDDPDIGYSCLMGLSNSADPRATIQALEEIARARGARVFGAGTNPFLEPAYDDAWFARLGYELDCEEQIWIGNLGPEDHLPEPEGLTIEPVDAANLEEFTRVLNLGFGYGETGARGRAFASTAGLPDWWLYLARIEGRPAAAAVLFIHDQVADCFAAATLPEFRGHGAQTALINRRLRDGVAAGCRLATSQTNILNASPRNYERRGFRPLYRRKLYGKTLAQPGGIV
jgi:ribosomal protein S18 acetylase RimI-like enzyme